MKRVIKKLALLTTGLAIGVVVERKKISTKKHELLTVNLKDTGILKELQDEVNRIKKETNKEIIRIEKEAQDELNRIKDALSISIEI